jgi:hypothetical protein
MATIRELLLLVEGKVRELPAGLKSNQALQQLARVHITLGDWGELEVALPKPPKKQRAKRGARKPVEPTPEFFDELKGPSVDAEDDASAPSTKSEASAKT